MSFFYYGKARRSRHFEKQPGRQKDCPVLRILSETSESRQHIILIENPDQFLCIIRIDHREIADVAMQLQDFQSLAQRLIGP